MQPAVWPRGNCSLCLHARPVSSGGPPRPSVPLLVPADPRESRIRKASVCCTVRSDDVSNMFQKQETTARSGGAPAVPHRSFHPVTQPAAEGGRGGSEGVGRSGVMRPRGAFPRQQSPGFLYSLGRRYWPHRVSLSETGLSNNSLNLQQCPQSAVVLVREPISQP